MAATPDQLLALGQDSYFRKRVRTLVLQQAAVVYAESTGITGHAARVAFALKLIQTPSLAEQTAEVMATRTNLTASTVTYDFSRGSVVTDATDAAILSQIATDWNLLAGV